MNLTSSFVIPAAFAIASVAPASAELIVDFSQNESGDATFSNFGDYSNDGTDRVVVASFTESATVFELDSGFPVFRGGARTVWKDKANKGGTLNRVGETYGTNPDRITLQHGTLDGAAPEFNNLMMVFKSDFAALSDKQVGFDANSSLSLKIDFQGSVSSRTLNWIVKDSGVYYLNTTSQFTGFGVKTLNDPNAANWVSFDPTANSGDLSQLDSQVGGGSPVTFNNIEAVGMFFEGMGDGSGAAQLQFSTLQIDAVAVPEPGSLGLIAAGGVCFLARRRRGA